MVDFLHSVRSREFVFMLFLQFFILGDSRSLFKGSVITCQSVGFWQ